MRIGGALAFVIYPAPFLYNVFVLHGALPDPASFGTGYAAVIAAVGAAICAKDIGVAKASTNAYRTPRLGSAPYVDDRDE
jgi:hypothetical protein